MRTNITIFVLIALVVFSLPQSVHAQLDGYESVEITVGSSIKSIVEELRRQGMPFAYSSAILATDILVTRLPTSSNPLEAIREILATHDLVLHEFNGLLIVGKKGVDVVKIDYGTVLLSVVDFESELILDQVKVRSSPSQVTSRKLKDGKRLVKIAPGETLLRITKEGYSGENKTLTIKSGETLHVVVKLRKAEPLMDEVVVFGSYYELLRDSFPSTTTLDQQSLELSPDIGNDPMRAIQRLPGAASSGASARSFVRGGAERESGIVLDGHRLLDPFHVRDYQSLFSAIDVRAVDGIEVFSGGFPVKYGNLNSSLILVDSIEPKKPFHTELGLSVFNTSALSTGLIADGQARWLISARRGNLDLIIDEDFGRPFYHDIFGKLSLDVSPSTTVSANGLIVIDKVKVVTSSDLDEREESTNDTRNTQFWLTWDQAWSDSLSSSTLLSVSDFKSERSASIDDPEKIVGNLDDQRDVQLLRLTQDWKWNIDEDHAVTFGGQFQSATARYNYLSDARYFGFFQNLPGAATNRNRDIVRDASGDTVSFYVANKWKFRNRITTDLGVRWDKQSYTDLGDNGQLSPRAGILFDWNSATKLRLNWGRYYQAQEIYELQVEDGIDEFFPAQRTDQLVLGIDRQLNDFYTLRVEAYSKLNTSIRPRFENLFDPLTIIPELEADRIRLSPDKARSKGIEFSLAYNNDENFSWWANYVLSRTEDRLQGSFVDRSWDQRHSLQLGLAWTNERWSYSAATNIHSGWPKTDVFLDEMTNPGNPTVVFGERNLERFDTFFSLDMRLEYERPIRRGTLSWFFELSNSTNRQNECCVDFDLDETPNGQFVLDKKVEYWFPLLPATGILWKF